MSWTLVTGSNRGIGLELCRQLAARGDKVIAACRHSSPALAQLAAAGGAEVRIEEGLDVSSATAVAALAERLAQERIAVLIHNAGILTGGDALGAVDFEMARRQLEVNALGPLRLTSALLDHLDEGSSKVIIITSRMGSIEDNTSGGRYGYRMSKAAVNMAGRSLSHDLKPRGIAVALLHPGFVRTDMTGGQGLIDADEAARGLLDRIDELSMANTGGFWHQNGERLPW